MVYDAPTGKTKGPKRINLDDPAPTGAKGYKPPSSLTIHLSKIDMPELRPKTDTGLTSKPSKFGKDKPAIPIADTKPKKDDKKEEKEEKKDDKKQEKEEKKDDKKDEKKDKKGKKGGKREVTARSWSA